jgi:uncharacterized membrane protein YcaP (DUF421 family)
MQRERIIEGEILAALRGAGIAKVDKVEAVVPETHGSLSVVPRSVERGSSADLATTLRDVRFSDER